MDEGAFRALRQRLRERAAAAGAGERGALDHVTPERVTAAAAEVRLGRTVSLAARIETRQGPDNPDPAGHWMTGPLGDGGPGEAVRFATDRFAMNVHGDADSHLDALCHVLFDGEMYGGTPEAAVTSEGARTLSVDLVADGVVGRGVLLDIPLLRGTDWLEPGDEVTADDLRAAESSQSARVGAGDILLVRVGHRRRRREAGAWNAAEARAGLHPSAMEFLADRKVAVLGGDGNNDTAPSAVEGVAFPVHVLAVQAMGVHLMDYLDFEELAPVCAAAGRWSFLCVLAPLRLPDATGSPVNPIAVL
ncbi:cyclase family protein [Streptomyces sp. NPDC053755]|uniref:cyclase family protein n=1 Tax=Streptomyces sp. NPDC053755 TaxID=3155815 RepID=UPI00341D8751